MTDQEDNEPANNIHCPKCKSENCFCGVEGDMAWVRCDDCGFNDVNSLDE